MKLALTVDLLNSASPENPLLFAKSVMQKYRNEAGEYRCTTETKRSIISDNLEKSTHAIQFDHCTLDLDVISDTRISKSLIQGFNLHEKLS